MSSAAAARPIRRASAKRSSIRYDLRRRVLVSNLNRAVSPLTEVNPVLPSKPDVTAPLDLLRDIPSDRRLRQPATSFRSAASTQQQQQQTPEKKIFRVDPAVLLQNPIVHTPTKAPAKRRLSEPNRPTISIHLLREHYRPPTKKDCPKNSVIFNPSAVSENKSESSNEEFQYDSPPARPVPLPRKSKMPISSVAIPTSMSKRPESSNSTGSEDSEDPIYAKIENCRTGSREDLAKYGYTGGMTLRQKPPNDSNHVRFLEECSERKRRNSLPINSGILRLRPRFSSTSGECRAKKSLLFSDSIDSTKTPTGLTVKNIHADREGVSLADLISKANTSPEAPSPSSTPRILNQSGIYSNNTLVVESKKLKKDEVDKSYGFACRMRPMLRVFNSGTPPQLLPNKENRRKVEVDQSPLKTTAAEVTPPPPRPPPRASPVESPKENSSAKTTPCKEIAVQTSFVVHGTIDCPQSKGSAKKRRRSMEIIAEVGAKVRRRSSILKDKLCRSLDLTPGK